MYSLLKWSLFIGDVRSFSGEYISYVPSILDFRSLLVKPLSAKCHPTTYLDQLFCLGNLRGAGAVGNYLQTPSSKMFQNGCFKEPWLQKYEDLIDLIHHPIETTIFDINGCFKLQVKIIQQNIRQKVSWWISGLGVTHMNVTIASGPRESHLCEPTCLWFQEISNQRTLWMDPEKTWVIRNLLNVGVRWLGFGPIWFLMEWCRILHWFEESWGAENTPTS